MRLILKTVDMSTNELIPKKAFEIPDDEIQKKTIREVIAQYAFKDILKGFDSALVSQAVDMMFLLIQPCDVDDSDSWWEQEITNLSIDEENTLEIALEFTELGKQFLTQKN
jgi:hypothetical protein